MSSILSLLSYLVPLLRTAGQLPPIFGDVPAVAAVAPSTVHTAQSPLAKYNPLAESAESLSRLSKLPLSFMASSKFDDQLLHRMIPGLMLALMLPPPHTHTLVRESRWWGRSTLIPGRLLQLGFEPPLWGEKKNGDAAILVWMGF